MDTNMDTKGKRGMAHESQPLEFTGSPGRIRTADQVVNSHPLYLLSYRGVCLARFLAGGLGFEPR